MNRQQSFDRLIAVLTSLRLTVVCLILAAVLVFWGTLAQVDLGLYKVQNEFFRSFLSCLFRRAPNVQEWRRDSSHWTPE